MDVNKPKNTNRLNTISVLLIISILPFQLTKSQNFCDFIQKVQAYQSSVKLEDTGGSYDILDSTTFNLQKYLSFFDHLNTSKEMKIGIYYIDNYLDGNPYLYAINKTKKIEKVVGIPSEKTLKRKKAEYNSNEYKALYDFLNDSCNRAENNIIPENSEMGFFQYLFFSKMGDQFALKWHSLYQQRSIICSTDMIQEFIKEEFNGIVYSKDSSSWEKLKECSPSPVIKTNEEFYEITWIESMPFFGVYKNTYKIDRKYPFRIIQTNKEKLLDINTDVINLY